MSVPGFWRCLEELPGLSAVCTDWQLRIGAAFGSVWAGFLQPGPGVAVSVPCPRGCGCRHEVVIHKEGSVGVCRCETWNCDDLRLTDEEVLVWELSWTRLGRGLCAAFGLQSRAVRLGPGTMQIGSWSAEPVPVILAIHSTPREFRSAVAEVTARLRSPFILLAPTGGHVDARVQELLANVGAAFYALDNVVSFEGGVLRARRAPGELFSRFNPQPKEEADQNAARQALAIVQRLETSSRTRAPSPLVVFRLYCVEEMSADQIARRCNCSKTTVIKRLAMIASKLGVPPQSLRRISNHLARVEETMADSRAKRIHPRRMLDDGEEEE